MENSIQKAGNFANAIKSIASIIAGIVLTVSSAAFAYSKIYENERNLKLLKQEDAEAFELLRERSDKRYKRIVDYVKNLKTMHKEDELRIIELEKQSSELKGYIKGLKEKKR